LALSDRCIVDLEKEPLRFNNKLHIKLTFQKELNDTCVIFNEKNFIYI